MNLHSTGTLKNRMMKKVGIIILMLTLSVSGFAQDHYFDSLTEKSELKPINNYGKNKIL